ncbi:unnamed protein product [Pleuronectes platessa]|uniref:Uncharacterized protein n=1 Tax=Pleuronectes platessa TaxID=8262 RepID=A0A9N7UHT3_PLEPL|nr:unnamed protein product [Pleuronectes platessa]
MDLVHWDVRLSLQALTGREHLCVSKTMGLWDIDSELGSVEYRENDLSLISETGRGWQLPLNSYRENTSGRDLLGVLRQHSLLGNLHSAVQQGPARPAQHGPREPARRGGRPLSTWAFHRRAAPRLIRNRPAFELTPSEAAELMPTGPV